MRALLAAIRCEKGEIAANLAVHRAVIDQAKAEECDLALFPEMSLTGSADPATHSERLIGLDHQAVAELADAASQGTAACLGIAERSADGVPHIAQVLVADGRVLGVQRKRHLGDGEESYVAASDSAVFERAGVRFGVAICAEAGFDPPFDAAAQAGASLVLFPAAPGLYGRRTSQSSWQAGFAWWEGSALGDAARQARRHGLWIALAGQAGSTVDEDFPGLAALVRPDGTVAARLPDWRAGLLTVDIPS